MCLCVHISYAVCTLKVVELWDRVYQAWVAAHPPAHISGPVVTSEAVAMSFDSLMEGLRRTPGNSVCEFFVFCALVTLQLYC